MMDWSYASRPGKIIRWPLRFIPAVLKSRIWSGPLRNYRWIGRSGVNGYWLGWYEKSKTKSFFQSIRPGDTVLDVGAHVGYYSLLAARAVGPSGKVFAFEPLPRNLDFLRRHKELNHAANLEIIPAAAGEKTGQVSFATGPNTSAGHLGAGGLTVKMVDLDSFTAERNLKPAVIKIDVEGGGSDVIRGARRMIAESRPLIFFAMHNAAERDAAQDLVRLGYKLRILEGQDLESSSEIVLFMD